MQKRTCPNGHVYDASIYGDQCPICTQQPQQAPQPAQAMPFNPAQAGHTHIATANAQPIPAAQPLPQAAPQQTVDASGPTKLKPGAGAGMPGAGGQSHTVIRRPGMTPGMQQATGRRLVGFLVTYNRDPMGKAFNIYEGRNYIGRDASCDISVPDDSQMSGRHMSILYRTVDDKFKFRDEQSSNGTFVNKELLDDGELQNYDIIRAGSTLFIFIAIPKIG